MSWIRARLRALPFWLRLGVPIALVVWLSVGLIVFLNYYNYYRSFHQLTLARYLVLGKDLRQTIEVGLSVGLAPRENAQLDPVLKSALTQLPSIRFIAVVDEAGRIQRSVGEPPDGTSPWGPPRNLPEGEDHWQTSDSSSYQVGLPYRNSFDRPVGALLVGYDRGVIDAATAKTRFLLLRDAGLVMALVMVLILAGVWALTRHLERGLEAASQTVACALDKQAVHTADYQVLGPEVGQGIPDFIHAVRRAFGQLEALARRVS